MLGLMGRIVSLIGLVLVVAACAPQDGARLVRYDENRFYFRHYPVLLSDETLDELAGEVCGEDGRQPKLTSAEQYYAVDIRYATYECI